ncbi:MAG: hypothetical protein KAY24_08005 [Candidatus Eisenbacteria sp.]|nr:hypothetical protein [Candidatus Eisenbacteria bacterium]
MSTFIVRFLGAHGESFRGKARHVRTGQEALFESSEELLAFLESLRGLSSLPAGLPAGDGARSVRDRRHRDDPPGPPSRPTPEAKI